VEADVARAIRGERPLDFERDALAVFAHQFEHNAPYRRFCRRHGRTPATVGTWRDVPAVPTTAFKLVDLTCGPPERVFVSSGTTRGADRRSRHMVPHLDVYRAAALRHFAACVAPDGMRAPVLALVPPPGLRPDSSLVQMVEWIRGAYDSGDGGYFIGADGLDVETLCARLETLAQAGVPCYLIGLTGAFARLFDHCAAAGRRFRLAFGTRIVDTGGTKGGGRRLSPGGFVSACWRLLSVPGYHCINEYGMTELCSQFYDNVLRERLAGHLAPRWKVGPPWTRTLVVDPESLAEVPAGRVGLLRHYDLANCGSVMAVQTEDLGVAAGDGFEIRGRVAGAEPRGCALLLDEINEANAADADTLVSPPRPL
jgi:hypothetical protein